MVCQFLLYHKVDQLYVHIYPHIPSLLHLLPTLPIPVFGFYSKFAISNNGAMNNLVYSLFCICGYVYARQSLRSRISGSKCKCTCNFVRCWHIVFHRIFTITRIASLIVNITHQSGTFVTTDEPTLMHHYHPKIIVYIRGHSQIGRAHV